MFGSALLDVAIGMVFVFLLLSLICSAFNELLETRLKNRASDLEKGIKGLLGPNTGLVDKLYSHGLIFSLFRGTYAEASKNKTLPSYIPSKNFANAIAGLLGPAGGNIPTPTDIRNSINQIANDQVKSALLPLLNDAQDALEKFRAGLEAWFNSAMDRVSGWYKRRAHVIIFACAFLIAVAMNVNSIALAQDLWTNQAKREALVAAAQGYLDKHPASSTTNPSGGTSPVLDQGLKADIEELKGTNVPIGWSRAGLQNMESNPLLWLGGPLRWFLNGCGPSLAAALFLAVPSK